MSTLLSLGVVPVTFDALSGFKKPWLSFTFPGVLSLELVALAGCYPCSTSAVLVRVTTVPCENRCLFVTVYEINACISLYFSDNQPQFHPRR